MEDNNTSLTGLDKISDKDYNSAEKNVAVDLTKVERVRVKTDLPDEIVKCDDYGHTAINDKAQEKMDLEKISDGDFSPEKRILSVDGNKLNVTGKPQNEITKDSSSAAPPDPAEMQFRDMPTISVSDEGSFEEKNLQVNLSPVTIAHCRSCNKELTPLEIKFFINKCAACYKKETEALQKKTLNKYFVMLGLILTVVVFSVVNAYVDNRALNITFTVLKIIASSAITAFFVIGFLAIRTGTNMAQIDYVIIGAIAIAVTIALVTYVAAIYEIITLIVFVVIITKEQQKIKRQKYNYDAFESERLLEDAKKNNNRPPEKNDK